MSRLLDFLADVRPEDAFFIHDGTYIRNLSELLNKLRAMDDELFATHVNKKYDDIASWIELCIGDTKLANELRGVTNRKLYIFILEKRIKQLELLTNLIRYTSFFKNQIKSKTFRYGPFLVAFLILLILSQVVILREMHQATSSKLLSINSKMDNFITLQLRADNAFFKHIIAIEALLNESSFKINPNITEQMPSYLLDTSPKFSSPQKRIKKSQIIVTNSSVSLLINNPLFGVSVDTGSMEPVIGNENFLISARPKSPDEIKPGDIISFLDFSNETIIHRVVEIGFDEEGWYAITKGDANIFRDPFKVRFDQIKGVLVGILY